MRDSGRAGRQPTILIGSHQEASSRSLESVFTPSGYRVLKAYTMAQTLERARKGLPDAIILDTLLPDGEGLEVCRELRRDPVFAITPILIISSDHATRQQRTDALRAGAWDHLAAPLDAEHLLLKLETFVRSKLVADQAREEGLLDEGTGLYNMRGLARRARELAAQAARRGAPLACVVFAPDFGEQDGAPEPSDSTVAEAVQRVATAFKAAGRQSDAIGRVGPTEFAVVAFGTDAVGSVQLADRLAQAVYGGAGPTGEPERFRLRAGYYVVPDAQAQPADAAETFLRAAAALRLCRSDPPGQWIRAFPDDASEPQAPR
jgi:PleD family two-component response regulator